MGLKNILKKARERVETTDKSDKAIDIDFDGNKVVQNVDSQRNKDKKIEKVDSPYHGISPDNSYKNRLFSQIIPGYTPTLKAHELETTGNGASIGSKLFVDFLKTGGYAASAGSEAYFREADVRNGAFNHSKLKGENLKVKTDAAEDSSQGEANLVDAGLNIALVNSSFFANEAYANEHAANNNSKFSGNYLRANGDAAREHSETSANKAYVKNGAVSNSKFFGEYLESTENAANDNSESHVETANLGLSAANVNSKFSGKYLYSKRGAIEGSKLFVTKEADVGNELLSNSFFSRVAGDRVSANCLDVDSYRSLIAADEIDIKQHNGNINVITPQKETAENHGFIRYTGNDWEEAKDFLRDFKSSVALNMFDVDKKLKDDYMESKLSKISDEEEKEKLRKKGLTNEEERRALYIESLDHLKKINKEFENKLEGLTYEDIDKEYEKSISGFNGLKDEHFLQLLKAKKETFDNSNRKSIESLAKDYALMDEKTQKKLAENLESGKKGHKPGMDIAEIAKSFGGDGYGQFVQNKPNTLSEILFDKKEGVSLSEELERAPEYEDLKKLYNEYQDEIGETAALADKAEIGFETKAEKQVKGLEHQRKKFGESLQKKEDSGYSIEGGLKQREKLVKAIKSKNSSKLEKTLKEDLNNKKRDYTLKAVKNAGKNKVVKLYKEATGEEVDPKNLSDNQLKALKVYQTSMNPEPQKLLQNENEVYRLPENQKWLEANGFDLERMTNFEYETSNIETNEAEKNVESHKKKLQSEMYQLLVQFNELTGNNYQAQSIEDFEKLKDELDMPEDEQAASIYRELSKEKPTEYKALDSQLNGQLPENLRVKPANPMDTIKMGSHFNDSCFAVGKGNDKYAAAYAVDVNKQVLYAYNQNDQVVGRVSTGINEKGELVPLSRVYNNTPAEIKPAMKEAAKSYANHLGLKFNLNGDRDKVSKLESENFYKEPFR